MGRVGSLVQGRITSKLSTSHNSFAKTFEGHISCGLASHRLVTILIHSRIICPFLRWHMHCHLSESLIANVCGSFESWLFSHWVFKLLGNCVGLNGWLLINPSHCSEVWLCSGWQGERKAGREKWSQHLLVFSQGFVGAQNMIQHDELFCEKRQLQPWPAWVSG